MKSPRLKRWSVALSLALCCIGHAQETDARPPETKPPAPVMPQGLPRLAGMPSEHGGARIPAEARSIVDIASPRVAGGVGRISSQGKVSYLALPPHAEWSTPLRPGRRGMNYVTFTLQASVDSIVSVDGAMVSLVDSEQAGYATVMVGYPKGETIEWMSLLHDVEIARYSGQPMGTLAIVTVGIDTEAKRWSIILVDRLVAYDLPLGPGAAGAARRFSIKTGAAGAWVCGVAVSDENPVFEDVNHNGVRDSFEIKLLGAPLARDATPEAMEELVNLWKHRSYIEPSDYALITHDGAGGPDWENVPVNYHPNIPGPDPEPEPAVRVLRDLPTARILNPNPTTK